MKASLKVCYSRSSPEFLSLRAKRGTCCSPATTPAFFCAHPPEFLRNKRFPAASRPITVHVLPRNLSHNELLWQESIHSCLLMRRHKQEYPPAPAPVPLQIRIAQINFRRIRKGRAKP